MKYFVEQKVITLKDEYKINDDNGNLCYTVTSPLLALTSKFQFFDKNNNEVAYAKRKIGQITTFLWYPSKSKCKLEYVLGVLEEDVKLTKQNFEVWLPDGVQWYIDGDIMAWNFTIKHNDNVVAYVAKNSIELKDTYLVDVIDDKDSLNAIIATILIDDSKHSMRPFRLFK